MQAARRAGLRIRTLAASDIENRTVVFAAGDPNGWPVVFYNIILEEIEACMDIGEGGR